MSTRTFGLLRRELGLQRHNTVRVLFTGAIDIRYTPSNSHNIRILPQAVTERKLSPEAPHACKRSTTRRAAPAPSSAEARGCSGPAPPATPALPLSSTPARHRRQINERRGAGVEDRGRAGV